MTSADIVWTPLEPGQLKAMRLSAIVGGIATLAFLSPLEFVTHKYLGLPYGALVGLLALVLLYATLIAPARRFARWGYARSADELHVAHGVWVHTETSVAFHRVQHIDVAQGPIERMYGVCALTLNTAGTMNSRIKLPGLTRETAEAMRDEIRAHIRAEVQ